METLCLRMGNWEFMLLLVILFIGIWELEIWEEVAAAQAQLKSKKAKRVILIEWLYFIINQALLKPLTIPFLSLTLHFFLSFFFALTLRIIFLML